MMPRTHFLLNCLFKSLNVCSFYHCMFVIWEETYDNRQQLLHISDDLIQKKLFRLNVLLFSLPVLTIEITPNLSCHNTISTCTEWEQFLHSGIKTEIWPSKNLIIFVCRTLYPSTYFMFYLLSLLDKSLLKEITRKI